MRTTIGLNIKDLREKKNMTQEELGKLTGVGATAVSQWETHTSVPRGKRMYLIAEALGVEVEALLKSRETEYDSISLDVVQEPQTPYEIATDLEVRIEAVERRLSILSRELADMKRKYENKDKK
jgi:transcriptional regulator with XRE-family HTH domain